MNKQPPKLLIVDDEIDVLEFAANFFRKRNIAVATASSGEEALETLRGENPTIELVLLDLKLPGIDGIEVLRQIKEAYKKIKVIVVSGSKPEEGGRLQQCRQNGALAYIHKPLVLDELEKTVLKELNISHGD
ncbi:MAG: response regulator [Candidatus Omnitrophota bacterium]|nr:response regulator [Candidatus Omnitrophota bacterium]